MPRPVMRGEKMNEVIVLRCHNKDKAELTVSAQKMGMDVSSFIRYVLIKEKAISPI